MRRWLHRLLGYDILQKLLSESGGQSAGGLSRDACRAYGVRSESICEVHEPLRATVFVSNHPSGARDFLATYPVLEAIAPNLKIVMSEELMDFAPPNIRNIFIPVHPPRQREANVRGHNLVVEHLRRGGNVLVYPAGRVAFKIGGHIQDSPWSQAVAKLIRKTSAQVVPVAVRAENSKRFYFIRRYFPRLSLLLLLRELKDSRGVARVYVGAKVAPERLMTSTAAELTELLRGEVDSLLRRKDLADAKSGLQFSPA